MLRCREFAYYASREDVLTEKEIREYHNTLLHALLQTVLEDGQLVKVLEDEEDEEIAPKVEEGYLEVPNILRWNFPIMGEIFIDILTNFVTTSSELYRLVKKCKALLLV